MSPEMLASLINFMNAGFALLVVRNHPSFEAFRPVQWELQHHELDIISNGSTKVRFSQNVPPFLMHDSTGCNPAARLRNLQFCEASILTAYPPLKMPHTIISPHGASTRWIAGCCQY